MATEVPPWLRGHVEALKRREVVERFKRIYVPTAEEIVEYVGERYRRVRPRRPGLQGRREFEIRRLEVVYNIIRDKLGRVLELPKPEEMDDFHRLLVELLVGDAYVKALDAVRKVVKLSRRFWDEYRVLIASAQSREEAARYRKEGCGRMLSLVRRADRHLKLLRRVREEMIKTHVVAEGLPVAVLAGIPSAGKSTLVRALSTAKPEVAPYPFTTKTILVGKVEDVDKKYYVVDTPGLLERPLEQYSEVERRAVAAAASLADLLLFVVDVSPGALYPLDQQMRLLDSLRELLRKLGRSPPVVAAVNKIDVAEPSVVQQAVAELKGRGVVDVLRVSAVTGEGLQQLKKLLANRLYEVTRITS